MIESADRESTGSAPSILSTFPFPCTTRPVPAELHPAAVHRHLPHLTSPHLPPSLLLQDVLAILYKTDEADDFVAPADEQVA